VTVVHEDETEPALPDPLAVRARLALRDGRTALGLLREPGWRQALAVVVVLSLLFLWLGRWQWHRHLERSARNELVTTNLAAAPVALDALVPPGSRVTTRQEWRRVQLTGGYRPDATVLIRNRPHTTGANDVTNGYQVVVPFRTAEGRTVLVDRGWIPAGSSTASRPDSVPAPPSGEVEVVTRLRPAEPADRRSAPAGQANRIDPTRLAAGLPAGLRTGLLDGYASLTSENPPAAATPAADEPPDPGLGINLAYAVQWVVFAVLIYLLLAIAGVKEVRRRAGRPPAAAAPR
jgi:cytochrome oxidase assembly protein ShyY1